MSNHCDVEAVLFLDCPESELEKRLALRGQRSGRSDDNNKTVQTRLLTYSRVTKPIIEHYDSLGKVCRVSGVGDPQAVFDEVTSALRPIFLRLLERVEVALEGAASRQDWNAIGELCDSDLFLRITSTAATRVILSFLFLYFFFHSLLKHVLCVFSQNLFIDSVVKRSHTDHELHVNNRNEENPQIENCKTNENEITLDKDSRTGIVVTRRGTRRWNFRGQWKLHHH